MEKLMTTILVMTSLIAFPAMAFAPMQPPKPNPNDWEERQDEHVSTDEVSVCCFCPCLPCLPIQILSDISDDFVAQPDGRKGELLWILYLVPSSSQSLSL